MEGATKDDDGYLKDIEFIGRIYDYEVENEHLMTTFQQFLDTTINDTNVYNFSSIVSRVRRNDFNYDHFFKNISQLTPKCEDILVKCFFKGAVLPCMMKFEMMETRRCSSGFCCSFNFILAGNDDPR